MNIISIDLEMNQPSGKIIQLGYAIANTKTQKVLKTDSILVNPNEPISQEITKLTGIEQNMINDEGLSLSDAYKHMIYDINKYQVTKHPLQWGLDHYELRKQLNLDWEDYIFRARGHDIKSLYQLYQMSKPNSKTISGLKKSMEYIGLEWDYKFGKPHNALADAHNTLLTYWKIADKMRLFDEIEKVVINVSKKKI